jgi:AraC-like DNA-binding protein
VDFFAAIGSPVERWRAQAGIPAELLDDPEALVPLGSAYRLLELGLRYEHVDDLALRVAERTSAFDLGAFGRALRGACTVDDYLRTGVRLIGRLSNSGTRLWLSGQGDEIRVNQVFAGPAGVARSGADLYTLCVTLNMLRQFIGPGWQPVEIRLLAGAEALLHDRQYFGDMRLVIGQRHTSFVFSRSQLRLPVHACVSGSVAARERRSADGVPMPTDFLSSAERLISSLVDDRFPRLQEAAQAAGMSPRTLQRRLLQAGTSFSELLAGSRMRLARQWLGTTKLSVTEIAAVLGYSDTANFSRAFRRECGLSPVAYRRKSAGPAQEG